MKTKGIILILGKWTLLPFIFLFVSGLWAEKISARVIRPDAVLCSNIDRPDKVLLPLPLGAEVVIENTIGKWAEVKVKVGMAVMFGYVETSSLEYLEVIPEVTPSQFSTWNGKLQVARLTYGSGFRTILAGMALIIPAVVLYETQQDQGGNGYLARYFAAINRKSLHDFLIFGCVLGGGMIAYGCGVCLTQHARILRLTAEGKARGYITAGVVADGKSVSLNLEARF